jgi:hypothetical protein
MEELSRLRFDALAGYACQPHTLLVSDERAWYSEAREKVLGTVVQDRSDKDYVCIVLGRDRVGRLGRLTSFLVRHNLYKQFLVEDATGKR